MTLTELVECFTAGEDPAAPSTEELYECLRTNNTKMSGPTKGQKLFQVRVYHWYIFRLLICNFFSSCYLFDLP